MNIYELKNKEISEQIKRFWKTTYGKVAFLLAYTIPILLMLCSMITIVVLLIGTFREAIFFTILLCLLGSVWVILITFILGSIYYYHELGNFIKETTKKK